MLPRNHSAGRLEETPLRTVHQRPPKKMAPSKNPAAKATAGIRNSFIVALRFVLHCFCFLRDPIPSVQTSDRQPDHQERQGPRMFAWMVFIQPDAERRAEKRRHDH